MMTTIQPLVLVGAVFLVGILHTIVPDHWLPIALFARTHRWSPARTARAAAVAGLGHTLSTLILGAILWIAGVVLAQRLGYLVSTLSSLALIAFGAWIAISSLREMRAHDSSHAHESAPSENASRSMTLLFILGSSPMIEGLPAFFAAGRYGAGLVAIMSAVFALATIATYVLLCVSSARGLQMARLGRFERYGEVLSGAIIALIGIVFLFVPVL